MFYLDQILQLFQNRCCCNNYLRSTVVMFGTSTISTYLPLVTIPLPIDFAGIETVIECYAVACLQPF